MRIKPGSLTRNGTIAVCAATAVLGLAACGSNDDSSSTSSGGATSTPASSGAGAAGLAASKANIERFSKTPTTIGPTKPIGKSIPSNKLIVHVNCGAQACTDTGKSLGAAAKVLGWRYKEIQAQPTPQAIQAAFQEALRLNPDGVASEGFSTATYQRELAQFKAKNIPVFSATGPEKPGGGLDLQLQSDVTGKAMALLADKVIVDSGGKAQIANVILTGYPIVETFAKQFAARIKSNCPDCKLKDLTIQPTSIGKDSPQLIANFLRANPGIKNVFLGYDDLAIGLPAATKAAGVPTPKTYSWAATKTGMAALRTGERTATVPQDANIVGWQYADGFARSFTGGDVQDSAKWSDWVLWSKDYDNIPPDNGGIPSTIADYQAQFKKLWGK